MKKIPFLYGVLHGKVIEVDDNAIVCRTFVCPTSMPNPATGRYIYEYVLREFVIYGESYWIYELKTDYNT